jgi:hypothetical protein
MKPGLSIRLCLTIAILALACGGGSDRRDGGSGDPNPVAGASLTSTFLTSTTGTSTIGVGDTIEFEVALTSTVDFNYDTMIFSITGDAAGNEGTTSPTFPGVDQNVAAWAWNYKAGTTDVKFSTDGVIPPADNSALNMFPAPVGIAFGFFAENRTGNGATNVIGTVTITPDTVGAYQGGAFFINGLDVFTGMDGDDTVEINTGAYTVVP